MSSTNSAARLLYVFVRLYIFGVERFAIDVKRKGAMKQPRRGGRGVLVKVSLQEVELCTNM